MASKQTLYIMVASHYGVFVCVCTRGKGSTLKGNEVERGKRESTNRRGRRGESAVCMDFRKKK